MRDTHTITVRYDAEHPVGRAIIPGVGVGNIISSWTSAPDPYMAVWMRGPKVLVFKITERPDGAGAHQVYRGYQVLETARGAIASVKGGK